MSTPIIPQKCCKQCGVEYPFTREHFPLSKTSIGGLRPVCRSCDYSKERERYKEKRVSILARLRELRIENPEKYRERDRQRYWKDPERERERRETHRKANRAQTLAANRRYNALHPNRGSAEGKRTKAARRRARKEGLPVAFTNDDVQRMMEYWHYSCAFCGNQQDFWHPLEREHWISVNDKRADNPGTVPANMLPACRSCNASKHDNEPLEWLVRKFGKRKSKQILERIEAYFAWLI